MSGADPNILSFLPANLTNIDIHAPHPSKPQILLSLSLHQRRRKFHVTHEANEIQFRLQSMALISMAKTAISTDNSLTDTAVCSLSGQVQVALGTVPRYRINV